MRTVICAIAVFAIAVCTRPVCAGEVRVPLTIDYLTLTEAMRQELYTAPGGRAPLWNGSDQCQFLYAEKPAFSRAGTHVKLETATSLSLGVALGSRCISPLSWNGFVEAESSLYVAGGLKLMLHVEDLNVYDSHHNKTIVASKGFDLIKQYLIPRLETFSYDLKPSIQQLAALAEAASDASVAERVRTAVTTIKADPNVLATDDGVKITLSITVPEVPGALPTGTVAPPTPEEEAALEKQLDQWDAFLVFAIKQLGGAVGDPQFRDELLQILLDSRYRLTQALSQPASAAGPDPVRTIFLDTWQKLGVTIRSAARRGQLGARGLEFLSFISAGDALFALDQAAPALGMRISADDLRRLAHIMAPRTSGDPLQFSYGEDPDLKKLLGPSLQPLSSPPESEAPPLESESPTEAPSASSTPGSTPSPSVTPAESPRANGQWPHLPWSLIEPEDACAAETVGLAPQLKEVASRLRRIVVDETNAFRYRGDMERLLELSIQRQLAASNLDARFRPTYRVIVKSAAWQESCWRQFIQRNDRVTWLESSTGDIGLMQVNKHVWRGFYDLNKLKWDVLYNAGAGSEILMEMTQHVLSRPRIDPNTITPLALARSVYASYNGGPDAYDRWRRGHEPSPAREIDAAYLEKYEATDRGEMIDILTCAADWGHLPGH